MFELFKRLSVRVQSAFKALLASQPQLPFDINRQVLFWLPFVVLSLVAIAFFSVLRSVDKHEEHVFQSSRAMLALGDLSTKASEAVMQSASFLLSSGYDPLATFESNFTAIDEAQQDLEEALYLHNEFAELQNDISLAIQQDLAFVTALANGDSSASDRLRIVRSQGPHLQETFTELRKLISNDREKHFDLLKASQRNLYLIFIAGLLFAIFSILYALRLSGNDLLAGFNRLSQDIGRLRRGERLSISNIPPTEMSHLDKQLLETSQHLREQNDALAAQTQELELQQKFRKGLSEFVSESLQHGFQTNFYQKLLDSAVEVIPDTQAGSLLLLKPDGRYHYEAVVNYQVEAMPSLSFDAEEIALHYSDTEPSRFQAFSINQELDTLATSENVALLAETAGGRHRAVTDSLAIPVLVEGITQAYLTLDNFERPDVFGNEAVSMAEILAAQVGVVITRLNLQEDLHLRQIEVQQRNEELARADRLKSEFLANMSHELRTPLTAILGFAELLKEELFGELNAKQDQYVGDIYKSGDHLLSLINDILDLSKIEAGHMDLNRDRHSINDLVDSVIGIMKERARKANVQIETSIPKDLDALFVDGRKVKQVLFNLISNAVKFTPDGGRVEINVQEKEDRLEIQVQDTGIGISPEDQRKLFQEFSQLDSSLTKAHEGTGLGLVLSKRFVELHGGEIWVESALNKGSAFIFTLPFGKSQVILHKEFEDFANTKLRPGVVIFADPHLVRDEVEVLKEQNYRVLVTNETSPLIEQLSRHKRVDLIILDEAVHKSSNLVKEVTELLKVTQQPIPLMLMSLMDVDKVEDKVEGIANTKLDKTNSVRNTNGIIEIEESELKDTNNIALGHGIDSIIRQPFEEAVFLEKVSTLVYRNVKSSRVLIVGTSTDNATEHQTTEHETTEHQAFKTSLNALGHDLTVCTDGETALEHLAEKTFDLLLCHFSLPDMSAADLLDMLEESDNALKETTVVLLSEDADLKEFFDDSIFFDGFRVALDANTKHKQQNNDTQADEQQAYDDNHVSKRLSRYLWHQTKHNSL